MSPSDKCGMDTGPMESVVSSPIHSPSGRLRLLRQATFSKPNVEGQTRRKTWKRKPIQVYGKKSELCTVGETLVEQFEENPGSEIQFQGQPWF